MTLNHYYPSLNGLEASVSAAGFRDYRPGTHSFSGVAVETGQALNLTGEGEPERVTAAAAVPGLLRHAGRRAARRGARTAREVEEGDAHVVVLSHGFWARRFGARSRRARAGRSTSTESRTRSSASCRRTFRDVFSRQVQLWVPLVLTEAQYSRGYTNECLTLVARLAPGTGIDAARTEMAAFAEQLKKDSPDEFPPDWSIHVTGLQERATKDVRPALLVLLGAVLLVLLIACANVANLLLTRASGPASPDRGAPGDGSERAATSSAAFSRRVRAGPGRRRRGARAGYVGARRAQGVWRPGACRRSPTCPSTARVLLFTLLVSVGTGVFVGLMPALGQLAHRRLWRALREGVRAGDDRSGLAAAARLRGRSARAVAGAARRAPGSCCGAWRGCRP